MRVQVYAGVLAAGACNRTRSHGVVQGAVTVHDDDVPLPDQPGLDKLLGALRQPVRPNELVGDWAGISTRDEPGDPLMTAAAAAVTPPTMRTTAAATAVNLRAR